MVAGEVSQPRGALWYLRGITSNERYVTRDEKGELVAKQQGLGRPEATCAALIPLRKSAEWWALTQDERRRIFEDQSTHIQTGMKYLPAVARRLHHCRDLGSNEPFDFVTWFEFARRIPLHLMRSWANFARRRNGATWIKKLIFGWCARQNRLLSKSCRARYAKMKRQAHRF